MIQQHIDITKSIRDSATGWGAREVNHRSDRPAGEGLLVLQDPRFGELLFLVQDYGWAYIIESDLESFAISKAEFISDKGSELLAERSVDDDINQIGPEQLRGELRKLRSAVRYHRDQRGDDRCWLDDVKLYKALPEGEVQFAEFKLPCRQKFLSSCSKFWESRQGEGDKLHEW